MVIKLKYFVSVYKIQGCARAVPDTGRDGKPGGADIVQIYFRDYTHLYIL